MKKALILILTTLLGAIGYAQMVDVESESYSFSIGVFHTQDVKPSDVDVDIPTTKIVNDKTFVVIFANENYQVEELVPYAIHDGEIFKQYCIRTLGIPEKNIRMRADATLNNMKHEILWLENALTAYKGDGKGLVYYSGHGVPNESNRVSYLLPVDGYGIDPTSGYCIDDLYADLGGVQGEVTYFFDACFSGTSREGTMLVASKGVAIKPRPGSLQGKAIAFSAAQGDETAHVYHEKSHGMFTYFLLKKLKDSKGDVNYGELSDYIIDNVKKTSVVENSKLQTPVTTVSPAMLDSWRSCRF